MVTRLFLAEFSLGPTKSKGDGDTKNDHNGGGGVSEWPDEDLRLSWKKLLPWKEMGSLDDFSRELGAIFQRVGRYFEGVWFYISAFWRHYPVETQRTLSWTIQHLEYHIHLFLHQFRVSCFWDDDSEITFGLELEICSKRKLQGYSTGILCVYCLDLEPVVISQCQRFLGCPQCMLGT